MKSQSQVQGQVDAILEYLGPLSAYAVVQWIGYAICLLSIAFHLFGIVFIGRDIPHNCTPSTVNISADHIITTHHHPPLHPEMQTERETYTQDPWNETSGAFVQGFRSFSWQHTSVMSEFDLTCDRAPLLGLSQTLLTAGQGLGSLLLPALADRFGRKRVHVIAHAMTFVTGTVAAFSPSYYVFAVSRVFVGIAIIGLRLTSATAMLELFPARFRSAAAAVVVGVVFAVFACLMASIAYGLRFESWRTVQLVFNSASLLLLLQILILDEPLRWLLANNKGREAWKVIRRAARWNKKDIKTLQEQLQDLSVNFGSVVSIDCRADDRQETRKHNSHATDQSLNQISDYRHSTDVSDDKTTDFFEKRTRFQSQFTQQIGVYRETELWTKTEDGAESNDGQILASSNEDQNTEGNKDSNSDQSKGYKSPTRKLTIKDVMKHRRMRVNIIISCLLWFVSSLTYNALYLMSASLTGDLYLNFFLNALVEIPSCVVYLFTLDRFGRKWTLRLFLLLTATGLISSGILNVFRGTYATDVLSTIMSLVGKFGATGSLNVTVMYVAELFPTNFRNQGLGVASAAGRVGSMIAPFATLLVQVYPWAPGIIFGSCSLLVAGLLTFLPETKGRELPQTVEAIETWYNKDGV